MTSTHSLLRRQLKRLGLDPSEAPSVEKWATFLEAVSRTYDAVDQDRYTIERSLSISSNEMRALYDDLKRSSETQLAEERDKLRQSLAVHKATLEASLDGILIVGSNRQIVGYNQRFLEMWGIPAEVAATGNDDLLLGSVLAKLKDPDAFVARVRHLYDHPAESSQDELLLHDGVAFDRHSEPVQAESGQFHGRVWFFSDITERRRDEARILEANQFLDSLVENLPHMLFVKDAANLTFVRFNRAGEELLGWKREDLIGKSDLDLFPPAQASAFIAKDREVLAQRGVVTIEDEAVETRGGGTRHLRTKKIPVVDQRGVPVFLLGISEDITSLRLSQVELRLAKEVAEKATRAKSEFLLNMSHEMRTPLNAILGFGRVLTRELGPTLNADQRVCLQDIVDAGGHMLQLVNDLLDLRSLEENNLQVVPIQLEPAVQQAVGMVRPMIQDKAQHLSISIPDDLPQVLADRRSVVQVVLNLLANAAKFTSSGGSLSISACRQGPWIEVAVADTGVGIAVEDQARLFVYFEQLGGKSAQHMQGSGVGLALTRALVEKQRGSIWVESVPGRGSTFRFQLPAAS